MYKLFLFLQRLIGLYFQLVKNENYGTTIAQMNKLCTQTFDWATTAKLGSGTLNKVVIAILGGYLGVKCSTLHTFVYN